MADVSPLILKVQVTNAAQIRDLTINVTQLSNALKGATASMQGAQSAAKSGKQDWTDMFKNLLNAREGAMGLVGAFLRLGTGSYLVQRAIQTTTGLVVGTIKPFTDAASAVETMANAYKVLTNSAAGGRELLEFTKQLSTQVAITTDAISTVNKTLLGFGFTVGEIERVLPRLADVTQGNSEAFQRLALVYGQVRGQGKAFQQDLNQFINAGVPILEALADVTGTAVSDIRESLKDGSIGFREFAEAIQLLTDPGGRFYQFSKTAADTFQGQMGIAANNVKLLFADMGRGVTDELKKAAQSFNDWVDALRGNMKAESIIDTITGFQRSAAGQEAQRYRQGNVGYGDIKNLVSPAEFAMALASQESRVLRTSGEITRMTAEMATTELDPQRLQDTINTLNAVLRTEQANLDLLRKFAPKASDMPSVMGIPSPIVGAGGGSGSGRPLSDTMFGSGLAWNPLERYGIEYGLGGQVPLNYLMTPGPFGPNYMPDILNGLPPQFNSIMDAVSGAAPAGGRSGYAENISDADKAMKALWETIKEMGYSSATDGMVLFFEAIGKSDFSSFGDDLTRVIAQMIDQLGPMFIMAGLKLIIMGDEVRGFALLGLGGVAVAFSAGYKSNEETLYRPVNPTQYQYANGAAFGGLPSLSRYSGGVYNSPTFFGFASGGVFGEAGPEAIMPLKRGKGGKLGVEASGMQVTFQVIDQSNRGMSVQTSESTGPNGEKVLRAVIRDAVRAEIASGRADSALQSRGSPAYTGRRRA